MSRRTVCVCQSPGARPFPYRQEHQEGAAGRRQEAEHAPKRAGVEAQAPPCCRGLEPTGHCGRALVKVEGGAAGGSEFGFSISKRRKRNMT